MIYPKAECLGPNSINREKQWNFEKNDEKAKKIKEIFEKNGIEFVNDKECAYGYVILKKWTV